MEKIPKIKEIIEKERSNYGYGGFSYLLILSTQGELWQWFGGSYQHPGWHKLEWNV